MASPFADLSQTLLNDDDSMAEAINTFNPSGRIGRRGSNEAQPASTSWGPCCDCNTTSTIHEHGCGEKTFLKFYQQCTGDEQCFVPNTSTSPQSSNSTAWPLGLLGIDAEPYTRTRSATFNGQPLHPQGQFAQEHEDVSASASNPFAPSHNGNFRAQNPGFKTPACLQGDGLLTPGPVTSIPRPAPISKMSTTAKPASPPDQIATPRPPRSVSRPKEINALVMPHESPLSTANRRKEDTNRNQRFKPTTPAAGSSDTSGISRKAERGPYQQQPVASTLDHILSPKASQSVGHRYGPPIDVLQHAFQQRTGINTGASMFQLGDYRHQYNPQMTPGTQGLISSPNGKKIASSGPRSQQSQKGPSVPVDDENAKGSMSGPRDVDRTMPTVNELSGSKTKRKRSDGSDSSPSKTPNAGRKKRKSSTMDPLRVETEKVDKVAAMKDPPSYTKDPSLGSAAACRDYLAYPDKAGTKTIGILNDDWQVAKAIRADEFIGKLFDALSHPYDQDPPEDAKLDDRTKAKYEKQQTEFTTKVKALLQTPEQIKAAKARCQLFVDATISLHENGVPGALLDADRSRKAKRSDRLDVDSICSNRLSKMVDVVKANKTVAFDVARTNRFDRNPLIEHPTHCLNQKITHLKSNSARQTGSNANKAKMKASSGESSSGGGAESEGSDHEGADGVDERSISE